MHPIISKYLELLWSQFQYDIQVFSQPWIYYWVLVPALAYLVFFVVKWIVLTAPLWLPVNMMLQGLRQPFFREKKK